MTPRHTIAVIDDDDTIRGAFASTLRSHGYRVEAYESAERFLAAARRSKASCLVIDMDLGSSTGLELARKLAAMGIVLPMIFATGSESERLRRDAIELGCVAYLRKPFPSNRLVEAVGKALS